MIQASGQASWADLVQIEASKNAEGQHITSSSSVDLDAEWGSSFSAGTCKQLYGGACLVAPWGMDISYHYLFGGSVSDGTIVDCINEQFIVCGCSLHVACSAGSGYSCHIGLETVESYLILRAVVHAYIYGICFTTPPRVAVVAPRWASGLLMLWPSLRCIPWLKWLATAVFWFPVSHLVTFGPMGIPCGTVCSASWVLSCAIGASLEGVDGVWPLPLWLVLATRHLSWQTMSTGLELWETWSQACWMAKWFMVMSASSHEGVLNGFAISFPRSFPSWQYAQMIQQCSLCSWCSSLIISQWSISV